MKCAETLVVDLETAPEYVLVSYFGYDPTMLESALSSCYLENKKTFKRLDINDASLNTQNEVKELIVEHLAEYSDELFENYMLEKAERDSEDWRY
jgi:hypothetical protein